MMLRSTFAVPPMIVYAGRVAERRGPTRPHSMASAPSVRAHEVGDALLVLGAERLGRRRERPGRLAERLAQHEQAAEPVAGLEAGELLADERIGAVGPRLGTSRYSA